MQEVGGSVEAEMIKLSRDNFPLKAIKLQNLLEQSIYNPQIEMFARFKMKSSFHKTKRII